MNERKGVLEGGREIVFGLEGGWNGEVDGFQIKKKLLYLMGVHEKSGWFFRFLKKNSGKHWLISLSVKIFLLDLCFFGLEIVVDVL